MPRDVRQHRRSIRLRDYDYARAGAYFITVCAHNRECLFGEIIDGEIRLNAFGELAQFCWDDLPKHYPNVELDAFVIMPNHVHGIIVLTDSVGAGLRPAPTTMKFKRHGLTEIVRALKSFSARRINESKSSQGTQVWQRNYYEHIIRNERDLNTIREYIVNNPLKWELDEYNPEFHS